MHYVTPFSPFRTIRGGFQCPVRKHWHLLDVVQADAFYGESRVVLGVWRAAGVLLDRSVYARSHIGSSWEGIVVSRPGRKCLAGTRVSSSSILGQPMLGFGRTLPILTRCEVAGGIASFAIIGSTTHTSDVGGTKIEWQRT